MKLDQYLSLGQTAASLARSLDINPVLISQWKLGVRPIPLERCVPIERATDGQVMRWDLRPDDWWQIWPELMCHPNAPEVPTISVSSIPDGLVPSPQGPGSFSNEVLRG